MHEKFKLFEQDLQSPHPPTVSKWERDNYLIMITEAGGGTIVFSD